jgi:hypothetical protein
MCTVLQLQLFFDNSDRQWIYPEDKMMAQEKNTTREHHTTHLSYRWTAPFKKRMNLHI